MSEYSEGPFFVDKLKMESGGLDFLGMRQATLDLREDCLPGFSNSTRYLRPFSVMCWAYWKLYELGQEAGLDKIGTEDARIFREKVEVLFTWGHQLRGVSGLPGITAKAPHYTSVAGVPLTFKAWKRIPNSTGLMAAVNYGPALKTTGGFGFLNPVGHELFQPMATGAKLAEALQTNLGASKLPLALRSLGTSTATEQDAGSLFDSWNIDSPTDAEKSAFKKVFYEPSNHENEEGASSLPMSSLCSCLNGPRH